MNEKGQNMINRTAPFSFPIRKDMEVNKWALSLIKF